jgi:hypothetical protein
MPKIILILTVLLLGSSGLAQTSRFSIGGVLEAQFGLVSSGAVLGSTAFTLKFSGSLGTEEAPSAAFAANLKSGFDTATGATRVTLGETFITVYVGAFDLSAGNLLVNWGAVDLLGSVSNVNPQDLTSQERLAIPVLRAVWNFSDNTRLEGLLAPGFTPSVLPVFALPTPTPPPGITIVGQNAPINNRPPARLENTQYGLRFSSNLDIFDGADFSISFYGGHRHTPTPTVRLLPTAKVGEFIAQPVLNYDWIHVLGLETNISLGEVALRAETSYTFTQDPNGTNPEIGNHAFAFTAQAETRVSEIGLTGLFNLQWQKGEMGLADTFGINAALIASYALDNRTSLSAAWVQSLTDGSGVFAPNLSYTLADGLSFKTNASLNYGALGSSLNPSGAFGIQIRFGLTLSF